MYVQIQGARPALRAASYPTAAEQETPDSRSQQILELLRRTNTVRFCLAHNSFFDLKRNSRSSTTAKIKKYKRGKNYTNKDKHHQN